ncbi:hypothetical protein BTA51_15875 [Hahella sp. CCB-MM4]|uniref:hypothetical protein n=1 Tax=Hahella sp. (strain CCB-MM4) TaxID=1926491 RepID=UPI000B9BEBD8|nr:hypothetical protein [Hahella sp. CCB-MM4]OZG72585.1 hypothetical protein BTA51_15875 [Hahella sp. CCB-MM4]
MIDPYQPPTSDCLDKEEMSKTIGVVLWPMHIAITLGGIYSLVLLWGPTAIFNWAFWLFKCGVLLGILQSIGQVLFICRGANRRLALPHEIVFYIFLAVLLLAAFYQIWELAYLIIIAFTVSNLILAVAILVVSRIRGIQIRSKNMSVYFVRKR